ncbi:pyrroloquinoline quinone biosynthesis protein PqqE [Methylobacterium sp. W2]|uniref:pyrroloquinoline quinone biosynthesis protein PqqE n=1 Tax=Methylobacterium sp. W2 TaxID=2598107 RepID=UPI001D0C3548|nr:pyrroloquinoline quinone biosynthesis protein PqqE [Methylobacterium sp. W2]MCC0806600.1 pyrroloquinoline quinone biosynthesis protein PqqE [Methylobacterium sp. W2]
MNAITPNTPSLPAPVGLLAELTHRCPLRCPYCSNPLELDRRSGELDTATWQRVLTEAAGLGVLHVHLSGGEPTARNDIVEITQTCARLGLYSNLITSGVGGALAKLDALYDAGLDHVQLSVQGVDAANAEKIGGLKNAQPQKLAFAERVTQLGLPLTLNSVIHRGNIHEVEGFIDLAVKLGAKRLEVAHTQYYGWAYVNRAALMPDKAQVDQSIRIVEAARERLKGQLVIDLVVPDYYAKYPKACAGGWGRKLMNVTPAGKVLPCHAAETIKHLEFWYVSDHSLADIWANSPAFTAYRGTDWMKEPCRSCDRREKDWGGCRCQALALAGDAAATDPACSLSPLHAKVRELAEEEAAETPPDYVYRTIGSNVDRVAPPPLKEDAPL